MDDAASSSKKTSRSFDKMESPFPTIFAKSMRENDTGDESSQNESLIGMKRKSGSSLTSKKRKLEEDTEGDEDDDERMIYHD